MDVMLVFRTMVIIMDAHDMVHQHDIHIHVNYLPEKQFVDGTR